jgi:hypothetical protein
VRSPATDVLFYSLEEWSLVAYTFLAPVKFIGRRIVFLGNDMMDAFCESP